MEQLMGSRFPRGKRGLKSWPMEGEPETIRRFPRGKRGLKLKSKRMWAVLVRVASPAGSVD